MTKKNKHTFIAIFIVLFILLLWLGSGYWIYEHFPKGERSEIGDIFGAINALFAGFALMGIVVAIIMQQEELGLQRLELKSTREVFQKQKFENTFFNLLSMQNQILNGIVHRYRDTNKEVHGREFFNELQRDSTIMYHGIRKLSLEVLPSDEIALQQVFDRYEISYIHIKHFMDKKDDLDSKELALFCDKQIFSKYQYKYAHYFRHLYRILKLIWENEQEEFDLAKNNTEKEKIKARHRNYSKFIQAQMSTPELFIMFYNSLKFGKMLTLINRYDFLENLYSELLLDQSHKSLFEFEFKSREEYFEEK